VSAEPVTAHEMMTLRCMLLLAWRFVPASGANLFEADG
jgi:hypothetical protein